MHYYQWNISDYRADTAHLCIIEHGIYRQLIDWYYLDEKPIPKITQVVMRRLCLGSDMLHFLENVLNDFFVLTENGYYHTRIEKEIEHYKTQFAKNRVNGQLGGRPKKTQVVNKKTQVVSKNNHMATQTKGNQELITNNQEPIIKSKADALASRLPKDWQPSEADIQFCKTERPELNPQSIADRFRDHWKAKAGADGRKLDWPATWRNWVRNENSNGKPYKTSGQSRIENTDKAVAEFLGEQGSKVIDGEFTHA